MIIQFVVAVSLPVWLGVEEVMRLRNERSVAESKTARPPISEKASDKTMPKVPLSGERVMTSRLNDATHAPSPLPYSFSESRKP